jgi:cytidylate kinase
VSTVSTPVIAVVAVDGPSGSGKSSVSRGVARALGLRYLDTGAMYRAVTWAALRDGDDLSDADAVVASATSARITLSTDPDESVIAVDGVDVTRAIREEAVTSTVSFVAAEPRTRAVLVERQRQLVAEALAAGQGIVVEGRDIGSVVLPDADLKVWLVADPQVRAVRRASEDLAAGRTAAATAVLPAQGVHSAHLASVAEDLARRDVADSSRAASPTIQAEDAVVVDATHLGLAEVIDHVVALVRSRTGS